MKSVVEKELGSDDVLYTRLDKGRDLFAGELDTRCMEQLDTSSKHQTSNRHSESPMSPFLIAIDPLPRLKKARLHRINFCASSSSVTKCIHVETHQAVRIHSHPQRDIYMECRQYDQRHAPCSRREHSSQSQLRPAAITRVHSLLHSPNVASIIELLLALH